MRTFQTPSSLKLVKNSGSVYGSFESFSNLISSANLALSDSVPQNQVSLVHLQGQRARRTIAEAREGGRESARGLDCACDAGELDGRACEGRPGGEGDSASEAAGQHHARACGSAKSEGKSCGERER